MRGKLNPMTVMRVLVLLALQYMLSCEASFQLPHVISVRKHLKPFGFRPGTLSHYKGKVGPIPGPIGPPRGILEPWHGLFGPLSGEMYGLRVKRGRKLLFGNGGPKLGPRFGPGGPVTAYNPGGPISINNPSGPMSANIPGGPMTANIPGGPMSANIPGGPMSANIPGGPMTANIPDGPMTANIPGGPMTANIPDGPMTANIPGGPMTANIPGGPMSANIPGGPISINNPGGPMAANIPVDSKSGVGASRPRGPFGPWATLRRQSLFESGGIGESGGDPYKESGRRRGRNDVNGDGPRGFADRSDIGSVYGLGPQGGSDLTLARGFNLGLSGNFDGSNNLMGRQNDDFLRRAGMGSGIGRSRNYLGTLGVGDNDRYRYTWDFSRHADLRNTGYRDNWRFGSDFDYYGDSRVLAGRMSGRPGSYQWNGWSMTGLDGYDDVNGYSGYGNRRRGWRRDQYGRRGMRRARGIPGYRRYDRNDRGYDSYDYDITRSFIGGNDRRFGGADENWDGYYSIRGSRRSSRERRGRGGGGEYESDLGKSGPRSKNDFKYPENGYTKIISENYIYENNGRSGKTSTSESSVDRGYNIGGVGNKNGNGLSFTDGNDGFRKNSVDQGGLSNVFVDRSVDNIGGPYSDTIGGNIGDAIGPEVADVGVSDIALGGGSEISVNGAVSDGVIGSAGVGTGGRDGNTDVVRIGGVVNGNGGKGSVDSGSVGSDRVGADGSVKVYRSRDSSNGGSGTGGGGNVSGGVNMSSGKSKYDLKYKSDDDDGTKIKRETYGHGNNGDNSDSNSNASVRGSGSASDVGVVSDKGSISSGRGNGASGSESVQFDNIQATVRDMLNLDRSDKGITSSGDFMSSSSSGNQRIERVDKVSDNAASSGSGSVDSSILGASDRFVGIGGDGAEFIIAGNLPGSSDKRGSDVKIGDVAIAGNVGKSVNHAKVEGGYTGEDETSISFVVGDLTGWR